MTDRTRVPLDGPICVFCGSGCGRNPAYAASAAKLGGLLAEQEITLVYGGSSVGLMGTLADAALAAGGRVVGIFPRPLEDVEVPHKGLTELYLVDSMQERKALMADFAEAFIALPGGFGTLDEICEILTLAQLGMNRKPIGLLNIDRYYDPLLAWVERSVSDRFADPVHRDLLIDATEPHGLLRKISRRQAANGNRHGGSAQWSVEFRGGDDQAMHWLC